ncbi:MAG TPA: zinc-binding protein [Cyanobacteria bacterium UBA8530]|nr:zinc-binding protein [Cyanobacteria bacterium UBA8530]
MSFTDQSITCADCGVEFTFTISEQEFFAQKGFSNPPRRCKPCRNAAKAERNGGGGGGMGGGSDRQMFDVVCDQCGVQTQVPFKPNGAKPVYCRDCFRR